MNGIGHLSMIIIFSISFLLTTQTVYAQVDILIDCDGIATAMADCPNSQEVVPNDMLTPWPTGIPSSPILAAGIDWFDRDNSKTWTSVDDLHSEALDTCPTANGANVRNGQHDSGDCPILDLDGNLGTFRHLLPPPPAPGMTPAYSVDIVDCDLETGNNPAFAINPIFGFPLPPPSCQDTRPNVQLTFFDLPDPITGVPDGFWNDGEDIVLDFNGNLIFDPPIVVGGKFLDVDKTALVLAGTQSTSSWVIPTLVTAIGFGLVIAKVENF
jgi:hypothetical protein